MPVGVYHRVETVHSGAHRLEPKIRRRIDHYIAAAPGQQDRRTRSFIARIFRFAHGAVASERRHAHRRSRAEHSESKWGHEICERILHAWSGNYLGGEPGLPGEKGFDGWFPAEERKAFGRNRALRLGRLGAPILLDCELTETARVAKPSRSREVRIVTSWHSSWPL